MKLFICNLFFLTNFFNFFKDSFFLISCPDSEGISYNTASIFLCSYGTGAIMAVPAHDSRDYEFAQKYQIPVIQVVTPPDQSHDNLSHPYTDDGIIINSSNSLSGISINGLSSKEASKEVINWLERSGAGKGKVL